ncbi:hypothetical protein ACGK9R_00870 [Halomonas sp. HNIBRBA4712]|uniref:hypothetical protein n=1 Tax=Halomonas sp. HNIBRBA4712 TaxID=3373087 RepID=UPI00374508B2
MAVYGGIQVHEAERWLDALTNAAFDRRCPLSKVHGGNARARTARQDLLCLASTFRGEQGESALIADSLSRWCQHYLTETEWYVLVSGKAPRRRPDAAPTRESEQETPEFIEALLQHKVG